MIHPFSFASPSMQPPGKRLTRSLTRACLLGAAAISLVAGSAKAQNNTLSCSFGSDPSHTTCFTNMTWGPDTPYNGGTFGGDKTFQLTDPGSLIEGSVTGLPSGTMSFIYSDFGPAGVSPEDNYQVLTIFDPVIPAPNSGSYAYTLSIDSTLGAGYTFKDVELDVIHSGSGQEVTKNATGVPDLISLNGDPVLPVAFAPGLTTIQVTDSWTADPNLGNIGGINNTFTQAKSTPTPGPLPLLGAGAAFAFSRRLRKRIRKYTLA